MTLPQATRPFVEFPAILRSHGFAIAPDQTMGFIEAIGFLGPNGLHDIHAAGLALLAIPHEREEEYTALFRAYFMGQTVAAAAEGDETDEVEAHEATGNREEIESLDEERDSGNEAAAVERLSHREFPKSDEDATLRDFARKAAARLPRRLSYRHAPASHGTRLNMRKALREAVRRDGEVLTLPQTRRKSRQRRIVLLADVSGSMKERTEATLRFAHALGQSATRFEAFTFGTRLTRITPALRLKNRDEALSRVGGLVADFDGGTRIGDALEAYLSIPRYAGFVRGAAVIVLSDGLERGDPAAMIGAVQRLSRLAWRLDWLTPLASEPDFKPRTEALTAVAPWLDGLADGGSTETIARYVLQLARTA